MADLYDRQKKLKLKIPNKVGIIGVGGVGSWVAVNLALVGVNEIVLVDPDIVELHNLNRTPFRHEDKGAMKVRALVSIISERRTAEFDAFPKKVEDLNKYELKELETCDYIVDARDVLDTLPKTIQSKIFAKVGYDGNHVTLHFNPDYGIVWGEDAGYETVPSYLVPPQLLASLVVHAMVTTGKKERKGKVYSFNISDIWKILEEKK